MNTRPYWLVLALTICLVLLGPSCAQTYKSVTSSVVTPVDPPGFIVPSQAGAYSQQYHRFFMTDYDFMSNLVHFYRWDASSGATNYFGYQTAPALDNPYPSTMTLEADDASQTLIAFGATYIYVCNYDLNQTSSANILTGTSILGSGIMDGSLFVDVIFNVAAGTRGLYQIDIASLWTSSPIYSFVTFTAPTNTFTVGFQLFATPSGYLYTSCNNYLCRFNLNRLDLGGNPVAMPLPGSVMSYFTPLDSEGNIQILLGSGTLQWWNFDESTLAASVLQLATLSNGGNSLIGQVQNSESGALYVVDQSFNMYQFGYSIAAFPPNPPALAASLPSVFGFFEIDQTFDMFFTVGYDFTSYYLYVYQSISCPSSDNCTACLNCGNFECGWCLTGPSSGSCSSFSNCTGTWIQQCLTLSSATYTPLVTGEPFSITMAASPFGISIPAQCFLNQTSSPGSQLIPIPTIVSNYPTCGISNALDPTLQSLAGDYELEVIYNNTYIYTSPIDVTFVNCSSYSSCHSCTQASTLCGWCLFDGVCVNSLRPCPTSGPQSEHPQTPNQCPVQSLQSSSTMLLPIAAGTTASVASTVLIIPPSGFSYACVFTFPDSSNITTTGSYISSSNLVSCPVPSPGASYSMQPSVAAQLTLWFNGHSFADNSNDIFYYSCISYSAPAYNCSSCINPLQPQCSWNAATGTCDVSSNCNTTDCLSASCPSIQSVTPQSFWLNALPSSISINGSFWTSSSTNTWSCQFSGVSSTTATFVSASTITCPLPTFTDTGYFTPATSYYTSQLTIFHNSQYYAGPMDVYWYECVGSSCSSCLVNGYATQCGWDPLLSECGTLTSNTLPVCPTISSAVPQISSNHGGLEVSVNLNYIDVSYSYQCLWNHFAFTNVTFNTSAILEGSYSMNCTSPDITQNITSTAVTSQLQVVIEEVSNNGSFIPYSQNSVDFTFIDCSAMTTCADCVRSPQCGWFQFSTCAAANASLSPPLITGACPSIVSISPNIVEVSSVQTITISVSDFPSASVAYSCKWTLTSGTSIFATANIISQNTITCQWSSPFYDLTDQALAFSIVTTLSKISVVSQSPPFTVFSCHTATSCASCSVQSSYCGWCVDSASCIANSSCSDYGFTWITSSCPFVQSVQPPYLALGYSRTISVSGQFFLTNSSAASLYCSYTSPSTGTLYQLANIINPSLLECEPPPLSNATSLSFQLYQSVSSMKRYVNAIQDIEMVDSSSNVFIPFSTDSIAFDLISCGMPVSTFGQCLSCAQAASVGTVDPRCGWCIFDEICSDIFSCDLTYPNYANTTSSCPKLVSINPSSGSINGGTQITVTGNVFFPSGTQCNFSNYLVAATVQDSTTLICTSPSASKVSSAAGKSVELSISFNNKPFTPSLAFLYSNPPVSHTGAIIGGVLGGFFFLLIILIILIILVARRMLESSRRDAFIKLREPDFAAVAFAHASSIFVTLSPSDVKSLNGFADILATDENFTILKAYSSVCTGSQSDHLARAAVYFYQSHSMALEMLLNFVMTEVGVSQHEGTLFRATSFACKLFNQYARFSGLPYLWKTLGYYINQLAEFAKEERAVDREGILGPGTMEVDPDRFDENEESVPDELALRLNQYELLARASKILKSIFGSLSNMRPEFRQLAEKVKTEVGAKFTSNNADYKAVGGFIFLRFICPSIMAPHVYGLLSEPPNETSQRYFVLLSKSLQNLANETLPGTNESFMERMNEFITKNLDSLHRWVDEMCSGAQESVSVDPHLPIPEDIQSSSIAFLQHLLVEHWDAMISHLPPSQIEALEPYKERGPIGKVPKPAKGKEGKKKPKAAKGE